MKFCLHSQQSDACQYDLTKSLIKNIDSLVHTNSIPTSRGALGSKDSVEVCVTTN